MKFAVNLRQQFLGLALGFLAVQSVSALPSLQLDTSNGIFDTTTQTTVSTTDTFDLWALAKNPSGTYYISAAITSPTPANTPAGGASFGSFKIGGTTYSYANGNMVFDTPPIAVVDNPLSPHGIFPTWYAEIAFTFGADTVAAYNVQDGTLTGGTLSRKVFGIDLSGLTDGYSVHFDLYDVNFKNSGSGIFGGDFAPFSHDAEGSPGTSVPDGGATAALLGMGVLSLAALRRKS